MYKTGRNITLAAIATICLFAGAEIRAGEVAIIVHPSVQTDSLDKKLLNSVYRGEVRSWEDGTKIRVWDLGERGNTRESFYDYIGIKPSRMKSIWMKQLLLGEGDPPDEAETQEEMVNKIMATPGSIGYVDKELVDKKGVKLLLLINKKEPKKSD